MEQQKAQTLPMTATALLEREYGQDPMAVGLIQDFRTDLQMSDEEIYQFLESFY